jgi:hypothetical protein
MDQLKGDHGTRPSSTTTTTTEEPGRKTIITTKSRKASKTNTTVERMVFALCHDKRVTEKSSTYGGQVTLELRYFRYL